MSRIYYRAAKAALVCFDVRSQSGFARAQEWIKELQEQEPECALYLVRFFFGVWWWSIELFFLQSTVIAIDCKNTINCNRD